MKNGYILTWMLSVIENYSLLNLILIINCDIDVSLVRSVFDTDMEFGEERLYPNLDVECH